MSVYCLSSHRAFLRLNQSPNSIHRLSFSSHPNRLSSGWNKRSVSADRRIFPAKFKSTADRQIFPAKIGLSADGQLLFSTSCLRLSEDDKYKSDPAIKGFMREISDDFEKKENIKISDVEHGKVNSDGQSDKGIEKDTDQENDKMMSKKRDLEDLLSELYSEKEEKQTSSVGSSLVGYSKFVDEDAQVIYDVDEERRILREAEEEGREVNLGKQKEVVFKYDELAQARGYRGVFDLEELVKVVKDEKISDLAVIRIPKERKYADYMLVGTGRNARHIYVTSQILKKLYKRKWSSQDFNVSVEGEKDKGKSGWIAMDMGNLILHLFTQENREYYNLESLWTLGPKFDELSQKQEPDSLDILTSLMTDHIDPEFQFLTEGDKLEEAEMDAASNNQVNKLVEQDKKLGLPTLEEEQVNSEILQSAKPHGLGNKSGRTLA